MHCLLVYIDFHKISAIILIFIPLHVIYFFPLAAFKVFSLSLILNNFIIICLGKDFFMFFEVGINWTSWICEFIKFEKVFTTISLYFLFFLISPLGMLIKYISGCLNCSQFTNTFFFLIHFSYVSFWIVSTAMTSRSLIFSFVCLICSNILLMISSNF